MTDWKEQNDYRSRLKSAFEKMSHIAQVEFAYRLSLEMFPFYEEFANRKRWGNIEAFRAALDWVQSYLIGDANGDERQQILERCVKWIPNDVDYGGESGGLCAGCAIAYAVEGCSIDSSLEKAEAVSYCAFELANSLASCDSEEIEEIRRKEAAAIKVEFDRQWTLICELAREQKEEESNPVRHDD